MTDRVLVQLSLEPGSLEDLLGGQWAFCLKLVPDPDLPDTYRLGANIPSEPAGEAWLRAPLRDGADRPEAAPQDEPTAEVASMVADLRERMGWT